MRSRNNRIVAALAMAMAAFAQSPATAPPADEKSVSIAGEVRNSLTLTPIERAHVSVRKFVNGKWDRYGVLTNAEGRFLIGNIPAGAYSIFVDRTGFTDVTANPAREMKLAPGEKKEDLKLKLTPTGEISGRVLDRDGAPMEGIAVAAERAGRSQRTALTDDRGMFRIGGVAPGKYRMLARPPQSIPVPPEIRTDGTAEQHYSPTYYPGTLDEKGATKVEVQAGSGPTGIDIRMVSTPILRVRGKVSGLPADAKNVSVSLSKSATSPSDTERTRPDGSFEMWRVNPGKYTLRAHYYNGASPMTSPPLDVEIGDTDVENLALQLMAPADIRGSVAFEDEEARNFVQPPPAANGQPAGPNDQQQKPPLRSVVLRDASSNYTVSGQIGEDGTFTLSRVQPGIYRATISPARLYVKATEFGQVHTTGAQVDLRSGAAGALTVHAASSTGSISGVVRDDKGTAGGSVVAIADADAERANSVFGTVKADGSYSFTALPPGKYRIVAYDEGDQVWANEDLEDIGEPIEVRDHEVVNKDLKKRPMPGVK